MAVIIPAHNSIFIHVPKTGGMSIQKWLLENTDSQIAKAKKHRSLQQLEEAYGKFDYSFAVVRNPWDWLVSWYYFGKDRAERRLSNPNLVEKGKRKKEYNQMVLDNFNKGFDYFVETTVLKEQSTKLKGVDSILKLENINDDIKIIKEKFSISADLPYVNMSSRKGPYQDFYTSRTKDIVYEKFKTDIKTFGYEF